MKKIFLLLCLAASLSAGAQEEVLFNAESGDPEREAGQCWEFVGADYTDRIVIEGAYSMRTAKLKTKGEKYGVTSPWILVDGGEMVFSHKLSARLDGKSRALMVTIIKYGESTGTELVVHNYEADGSENKKEVTLSLDGYKGVYKFLFQFTGENGETRGIIDNVKIPGEVLSDPANNCEPRGLETDSDRDGVADLVDAYPDDAFKAYDHWMISSVHKTIMFEDMWPSRGDYDFNDLVVDWRVKTITNASEEVVEMELDVVTRAIGGSFKNGFAMELTGISPDKILTVKGANFDDSKLFKIDDNGTEANQRWANIVAFGDAFKVFNFSGGGSGINTNPKAPKADYDTARIIIYFSMGEKRASGGTVRSEEISFDNFNPYMIVNQDRGKEVHLPNHPPSSMANEKYFGQEQDATNPGEGTYYKTRNNLPWALTVSKSIPYSTEKTPIHEGFTMFLRWAESNGSAYTDWYDDLSDYRRPDALYDR